MGLSTDLQELSLGDVVRLAARLRSLSAGVASIEAYADRLCATLAEAFADDSHGRQVVLARFYLTQPAASLPPAELSFAGEPADATRCLTLLGSAGDLPEWNDRRQSVGHLCIPLTTVDSIAALPMVSGLMSQMRVDVPTLVRPAGLVVDPSAHRFGVFHVPEAAGSALIPGQDFVRQHGIASVVGIGGVLPDGEMYALVLFTVTPVSLHAATLLETLSPSITLTLTDLLDLPTFADLPATQTVKGTPTARAAAREGLLRGLLEVHERVAEAESDRTRAALARVQQEAERSASLARTLQASLLPLELPKISGLKSAAFFHPAGDGSEIGGDFYDLFPIRRGTWGLVLGDVSGKGASAASLTALARHTVRAAALRARTSPAVLHVLNEAVYRQQIAEHYLTALFALVTRRGPVVEIDLCLGGHEPPHLLRPGQPAAEVGACGQPLGLFPRAELTQSRFDLRRADTLVTYTDGVTDARRGRERYGSQRVEATLSALSGRPVSDVVAALATGVQQFQGEHAVDDMAILAIQSTR